MSRTDIHPDALVDRELDGTLGSEDADMLARHRDSCGACKAEEALLADFAEELAPTPEDAAVLGRLVDRLAPVDAPPVRRRRRSLPRVALVAAAVLLFSGAAAGFWAAARIVVEQYGGGVSEQDSPSPETSPAPRQSARPGASPTPEETDTESTEPDPPAEPAEEPPATEASPLRPAPSARELFASANEARRDGRHRRAAGLYRELRQRHPGSREEVASRVSMGRLLLDRLGDPGGALRSFDNYLTVAPAGTLAQEARLGRAVSLGRLGRERQEAAAWRALLDQHPGSIHAGRARRRLEELEGALTETPPR